MNLMGFVHVHNEFLMQSQILFCFMHNIFLYFVCACVCASFTCSTIGSCSGGFLFSTPIVSHTWNAVSCSAKKGLCCGHKTHTQCLSGFYAYTVMSQSAVTTLSYHKSPDTMSLEVTLHCSSNINLDLSWSPPPPHPSLCAATAVCLIDWLLAAEFLIMPSVNIAVGITTALCRVLMDVEGGNINASRLDG